MSLDIERILFSLPSIIIGLSVHEFFHAYVALKLGDSTAYDEGRVSVNPLRHLDPFGLILIVLMGFGWAKAVRFNSNNLKKPKRDRMIIAIAGPVSNLLLGLLSLIILKIYLYLGLPVDGRLHELIFNLLIYSSYINLGLFIFNMLPIPPLDGSHILFSAVRVSPSVEHFLYKYGFIVLIAVLFLQSRTAITILPIQPLIDLIVGLFFK